MIGGLEHRTFRTRLTTRDAGGLEFRLEGYASLTQSPYDMGSYTESISRGAFTTKLAKNPDVQLLVNHGGLPLARTTISPGQVGHLALSRTTAACTSSPNSTAMTTTPWLSCARSAQD
jgi:hypothetical protein